jgi:transglutaminase-like putative cysteine protease
MDKTKGQLFGVAILAALCLTAGALPAVATTGWLPISPEDLALKDNPKQPGANAMILYREDVVNASLVHSGGDTVEEYMRIKIFTQEGTKEGHVEIPFVKENESVSYLAGRTIRPDGSIVTFDGQAQETVALKQGRLRVLVKSFTLPDVQPGCIIEYRYQLQGKPDYVIDREWKVTQPIYTREAHFTYVPLAPGGLIPMHRAHLLPADADLKLEAGGFYTMVVHDIPGLVEEDLMPPQKPVEARVSFYYQDPDAPSATDPSNKYWDHYAKKWDSQLEHFIDKKSELSQEVSKIVAASDSPEAKLRKIYDRVEQIRNLNMEDYKTQQESKDENLKPNNNVADVLTRGYGTERQINYLFVGLVRAAGLDATEAYVATRNSDLFVPASNDVNELQADIVWVRAGSQEYYLDPGARYYRFGLLPWFETETGGIRLDKHGATIVNTPAPVAADATLERKADLKVNDNGSISGTLTIDFTGQRAGQLREEMRKEDETGRKNDLEEQIKHWLPVGSTVEVTKIENWDDIEQPVHLETTIRIPSFAGSATRHLLMPLEIFQPTQMSSFLTATRVNPIYFHYPYQEIDDLELHSPTGYKAEAVPDAQKVNLGAVSYEISALQLADGVEVKRQLTLNGILFGRESYPALRAFFGLVRTKDNAQMVLEDVRTAKNN